MATLTLRSVPIYIGSSAIFLTHEEVKEVLGHMSGIPKLMVELLYCSGLRLQECLNLRVKDIDFSLHTITVRQGKGDKDRTTLLPSSTEDRLQAQIQKVLALHQLDMADGYGEVYMPHGYYRMATIFAPYKNCSATQT